MSVWNTLAPSLSLAPQTSFDTTTLLSCLYFDTFLYTKFLLLPNLVAPLEGDKSVWNTLATSISLASQTSLVSETLLSCHYFDKFLYTKFLLLSNLVAPLEGDKSVWNTLAPTISLAPRTSYVSETLLSCHYFDKFLYTIFFLWPNLIAPLEGDKSIWNTLAPSLSLAPQTSFVTTTLLSCQDFDNFCFPIFFWPNLIAPLEGDKTAWNTLPPSLSFDPRTTFVFKTLLSCHDFDKLLFTIFFLWPNLVAPLRWDKSLWNNLAPSLSFAPRTSFVSKTLLSCHFFDKFLFSKFLLGPNLTAPF